MGAEWLKVGAEWRFGDYSLAVGGPTKGGWWVFRKASALNWLPSLAEARAWVEHEVDNGELLADLARLRMLVDYLPTGKTGEAVNLINRMEYQLKHGAR
jgi:hypothetical protein